VPAPAQSAARALALRCSLACSQPAQAQVARVLPISLAALRRYAPHAGSARVDGQAFEALKAAPAWDAVQAARVVSHRNPTAYFFSCAVKAKPFGRLRRP